MYNHLLNIKKSQKLCAIYSNPERVDMFTVGYVEYFDEDILILRSYDYYGREDGFICIDTSSIIKIECDSEYLNTIRILIDNELCNNQFVNFKEKQSFLSILEFIKSRNLICSIELYDSQIEDAVGFISRIFNDGIIEIKGVNSAGKFDGECILKLDCISCISVYTLDNIRLEKIIKVNI